MFDAVSHVISFPPAIESDAISSVLDVVADDEEPSGVPDPGAFASEIRQRDPQSLQFPPPQLHVPALEDVLHVGGELDPFSIHVFSRHHVCLGKIPSMDHSMDR